MSRPSGLPEPARPAAPKDREKAPVSREHAYEAPRIAWEESFGADGTIAIGCGKTMPFQAEACASGPVAS